jgi:hypothetical protein
VSGTRDHDGPDQVVVRRRLPGRHQQVRCHQEQGRHDERVEQLFPSAVTEVTNDDDGNSVVDTPLLGGGSR